MGATGRRFRAPHYFWAGGWALCRLLDLPCQELATDRVVLGSFRLDRAASTGYHEILVGDPRFWINRVHFPGVFRASDEPLMQIEFAVPIGERGRTPAGGEWYERWLDDTRRLGLLDAEHRVEDFDFRSFTMHFNGYVSVVLPVYNEAGHLRREIERIRGALESSPYSFEIVVVDDGSTDTSGAELLDLDGIRLIHFAENRGAGSARKVGTRSARGRVVVWTDVDMTYPNHDVPRLVKELEGYDQVVGARTSEQGTTKWLRVPAKWSIRRLAAFLLDQPVPDLNSGFRAFRRDVALQFLHLLPRGFSCVSTMTMSFLANGYSVKYVDIDYLPRAGRSKFHPWVDTKAYVTQVIRMILSYNPLRVFLPVGFFLTAVGLGKLGYDWVERDFALAANTLLILFAAFQTFAVGLLADLMVRVTKPECHVDPAMMTRR